MSESFKNPMSYIRLKNMVTNHHLIGTVRPVKNGFVLDTINFLRVNKMRSVEVTGLFTVKEVIRYKGSMRITFEEIEYIFDVRVEDYITLWQDAVLIFFEEAD
jgi:hypothetical protein